MAMSDQQIVAELAVRKERESFRKRRSGVVKKIEQLKRVWPLCDIEHKVLDHATGQYYIFQTSSDDLPPISELKNSPELIAELLSSNDFMTDDEDSNNDEDGDNIGEVGVTRRKIKNIRQKRKSPLTTPKKKGEKELAHRPARVPPISFIKEIVLESQQENIGTRRYSPKRQKSEGSKGDSNRPAVKPSARVRKAYYTLPPIPVLKSGEETPMIAERISEIVM